MGVPYGKGGGGYCQENSSKPAWLSHSWVLGFGSAFGRSLCEQGRRTARGIGVAGIPIGRFPYLCLIVGHHCLSLGQGWYDDNTVSLAEILCLRMSLVLLAGIG